MYRDEIVLYIRGFETLRKIVFPFYTRFIGPSRAALSMPKIDCDGKGEKGRRAREKKNNVGVDLRGFDFLTRN